MVVFYLFLSCLHMFALPNALHLRTRQWYTDGMRQLRRESEIAKLLSRVPFV